MKKFDADGAVYGIFDMSKSARSSEAALPYCDLATVSLTPSPVCDLSDREDTPADSFYKRYGKRIFELLLIVLALPFTLPLVVFCAIALWIESGFPFYTQDRLGLNGRRFRIVKLRTMTRDADAVLESHLAANPKMRREWEVMQKIKDDPRITPMGHILRTTSLDELPQFLNVLNGDMSLVGPRPMMPEQLPLYGDPQSYFALRPGITGFWQISARNSNGFSSRNKLDDDYNRKMSLSTDLIVLFKTVGVVLRRTGC